jgi:hypothetical protein
MVVFLKLSFAVNANKNIIITKNRTLFIVLIISIKLKDLWIKTSLNNISNLNFKINGYLLLRLVINYFSKNLLQLLPLDH